MRGLFSFVAVALSGTAFAAPYEKSVEGVLPAPLKISCAETAGWTFDVRTLPSTVKDVAEVEIRLARDAEALPPSFSVSSSVPQGGIRYRWSADDRDFGVTPTWAATVKSDLAHGMPLYSFFAQDDENRLTLACTEARRSVTFMGGMREVTRNFDFSWTFFEGVEAPLRDYRVRFRFDRRRVPFADALRTSAAWVPAAAGFAPAVPPAAAYEPLYSTWYAFHRGVTAEDVERECAAAAELGMKVVIVDDGWQIDDGNGYDGCGDWQPSKKCFPDMKGHVARVQAMGMKYMLWYSMPLVGEGSANFARFKGKYLRDGRKGSAAILDPRFPEVRDFLCGLYERAMKDWNVDGFKLDFIGQFKIHGKDPAIAENYAGRDFKSVPDAVERLLSDVTTRLKAIRPDVLIEFRQPYVGPEIRKYGNMMRVSDCPGCIRKNRMGIANLRLVSPGSAIHADMLEWHAGETTEDAAMYVLNCLFGVIQYSEALSRLPESHRQMIRHWVGFSVKHAPALLQGAFLPHAPEFGYPVLEGASADERVIAVYDAARVASAGSLDRTTLVVNATAASRLVLDLPKPCHAAYFDTFGAGAGSEELAAGIVRANVPRAGYAVLALPCPEGFMTNRIPAGAAASGSTKLVYGKTGGVPTKDEFTFRADQPFYAECVYELSENIPPKSRTMEVCLTNGERTESLAFGEAGAWAYRNSRTAHPGEYGLSYDPTVCTFCWWKGGHLMMKKTVAEKDVAGRLWFEIVPPAAPVTMKIHSFRVYRPGHPMVSNVQERVTAAVGADVPKGAVELGLGKCLFDERPKVADISPDRRGKHKWYSGQWYAKMPPMDLYRDVDGALEIAADDKRRTYGDLVSCPRKISDAGDAQLPFLDGAAPFYVEFEVSLSDNDPDHFAAVWLMPVEKIFGNMPHYEGDPTGEGWKMERWTEIDVDEANFGPGMTGTVHNWWGFGHPNYHHIQNPNNVLREKLDRTQRNRFGASYDPKTLTVKWYLNDRLMIEAAYPYVSAIAREQHFYMIMGAQWHGKHVPYKMYVHRVRAYVR